MATTVKEWVACECGGKPVEVEPNQYDRMLGVKEPYTSVCPVCGGYGYVLADVDEEEWLDDLMRHQEEMLED